MKQISNNFAYGAAALLVGAMAFASCSSDDDVAVNPSFDGEAVKTQFAINIPRAAQGKTRMTSGNTQATADDAFLGMQNLRLYPFTAQATTATDISSVITLPELTTSDIYGTSSSNRSSKIYNDVTIPVGTTHFLFYGQAKRQTVATDFANGNLTTTFGNALTKVENINFKLVDILPEGVKPEGNEQAESLIIVLNGVAQVENWSSQTSGSELKNLYDRFVGLKAGSAASITAALQSLYNAASKLHTTDDDIAGNIMTKITEGNVFTPKQNEQTKEYTLTYNKEGDQMFPRNLNLPDGAVALNYDETGKKFSYVSSSQAIGSESNCINVSNVVYSASLYYFASTTLRASDNSVAAGSWPTTTTDWTNGFKDSEWQGTVLATTRSIAMTDNINYGVGNLALSVQAATATLLDREYNGAQRDITVGSETFPIKAILIGGQPTKAGFDFQPATGAAFTKTIYDKVENGKYANYISGGGIADVCNYTLALPNAQTQPQKIQFAIELENNSNTEFIGYNNQIIYKGSKFYLIGYLDPAAESGNVAGETDKDNAPKNVFESDYMTRAKVSIKSLENAYNVIPDLRSTNLEFGLSVDLEWKKGLTFDVVID